MNAPAVSLVIPCLNECQTIATCVTKARSAFTELGIEGEVVVSDNGSTDGSDVIAEHAGARVVRATARGYGNAYLTGFREASGRIRSWATPTTCTTSACARTSTVALLVHLDATSRSSGERYSATGKRKRTSRETDEQILPADHTFRPWLVKLAPSLIARRGRLRGHDSCQRSARQASKSRVIKDWNA